MTPYIIPNLIQDLVSRCKSKLTMTAGILFICVFYLLLLKPVSGQTFRYPIAELGNCRDAKECFLYCQIPQNKAPCWSYGKYKLGNVLGESTADENKIAKEHGITFPISQLGNCANVSSCKAFCEKPENHKVCMDFARSKSLGVYSEQQDLLQKAKQELGCTSYESCQSFCENPNNREKCMKLAEQNQSPELKAKKEQFIQKAKEVLGCDSYSSCKTFCENPNNREKCMNFAQQYMPAEMKQQMQERSQQSAKPAQCNSEESCRKYCQDNPNDCPGYSTSTPSQGGYSGPGGCKSEQECQAWCQQNPDKCPGYKQSQQNNPQPTYVQPTYSNPTSYPSYNYPSQSYQQPQSTPTINQSSPSSNYSPPQGDDPVSQCNKTPGCSWTGSTCQCSH